MAHFAETHLEERAEGRRGGKLGDSSFDLLSEVGALLLDVSEDTIAELCSVLEETLKNYGGREANKATAELLWSRPGRRRDRGLARWQRSWWTGGMMRATRMSIRQCWWGRVGRLVTSKSGLMLLHPKQQLAKTTQKQDQPNCWVTILRMEVWPQPPQAPENLGGKSRSCLRPQWTCQHTQWRACWTENPWASLAYRRCCWVRQSRETRENNSKQKRTHTF